MTLKTGNKKQAAILGVVAVGAIAFLVMQLMPSSPPKAAAKPSEEPAQNGAALDETHALPLTLVKDPFSSVHLLPRKEEPKQDATNLPEEPIIPNDFGPAQVSSLPGPAGRLSLWPDDSIGNSQPIEKETRKLRLEATANINGYSAFIAADGHETRRFKKGDKVTSGVTLVSIDADRVVLLVDGRQKHLWVGEEKEW